MIGLYAHHDPKRTGPYRYLDYVVSAYQSAIDAAYPNGAPETWRARVKDKNAMQRISAAQVIAQFDRVIEKEGLIS